MLSKKKMSIIILLCCVGSIFLTACFSEEQGAEPFSRTELLLDTYCTITINGADDEARLDGAFDICRELDGLLSITDSGSDVWRINHAFGEAVSVSPHTIALIRHGMEFGLLSNGMFDISIGRLSRLWDFGGGSHIVPSEADIEAALQTVRHNEMQHITIGDGTVQLSNSETWLDFGGIAKGYIADEIASYLSGTGVESALIDLGGDIYALGCKPDGSPWRIGVRRPFGSMDEYIGVLEVMDSAVVSSGVYERQFEADGVLYHHILDPFTGMPAQSDVISATIVAESAIAGEFYSTLAVLLGSVDIQAVFDEVPGFVGAVLVLESGDIQTIGEINLLT